MRPVVLSVVEGKNFLLGTFDTTNFQDWWKSEPFPGAIDEIQQPIHVYGQYHVCICKMSDGTYSIYRTKNMGKSWTQVYNTANIIYTLTLIDYGWVIGSTSAGWIESWQDSGYTWNEISSFAPNCKTVINVGDDILFAHDGNYIWKSEDIAETWKKVLDVHNIVWKEYHGSGTFTTQNTGYVPPALAGYGSRIIAGCGPYIVFSDDYGISWTMPYGWIDNSGINTLGQQWLLPRSNVRILQIALTDRSTKEPDDIITVVRLLMINQNKVRYIYNNGELNGANGSLGQWHILFDLNYYGEEVGSICSYDVLSVGTSQHDIFSTIASFSSDATPIFLTTTDGVTWTYPDISNVTVYEGDPTNETISDIGQQVFEEEYIAKYTWLGVPCHNSGKWKIEYNKTIMGLSSDYDLWISFRKLKGTSFNYTTSITKYSSITPDILNKKTLLKDLLHDILIKNTAIKPYLASQLIRDTFTQTFDDDIAIANRNIVSITPDILNRKAITKTFYYDVCLFDTPEKTYSADIRLIDDHMEEITVSIERYTPQSLDIEYLDLPYKPYDSRTQRVVP